MATTIRLLLFVLLVEQTSVEGAATEPYKWDGPIPVWLWYEYNKDTLGYENGIPGYMKLDLELLKSFAKAPKFVVHMVSSENIRDFIPDMVEEFDRLPYPAATSDLIRTVLLARHGGVYLDTDFLVTEPMEVVTDLLDAYEFVAYESFAQNCSKGVFSSNFIAGRPNNPLSKDAWTEIQRQLKQKCMHKDGDKKQGVCCFEPNGDPRQCHIPWAGLGEVISHSVSAQLIAQQRLKIGCFDYAHGFVPAIKNAPNTPKGRELHSGGLGWVVIGEDGCRKEPNGDLRCKDDKRDTVSPGYFNRFAYHLFASTLTAEHKKLSVQELLNGKWAVSELFRRARDNVVAIEDKEQKRKKDALKEQQLTDEKAKEEQRQNEKRLQEQRQQNEKVLTDVLQRQQDVAKIKARETQLIQQQQQQQQQQQPLAGKTGLRDNHVPMMKVGLKPPPQWHPSWDLPDELSRSWSEHIGSGVWLLVISLAIFCSLGRNAINSVVRKLLDVV